MIHNKFFELQSVSSLTFRDRLSVCLFHADGDSLLIGASEIQMVAGHINLRQCLTCLFVLVTAEKASELRKLLNRDGTVSFNPDGGGEQVNSISLLSSNAALHCFLPLMLNTDLATTLPATFVSPTPSY